MTKRDSCLEIRRASVRLILSFILTLFAVSQAMAALPLPKPSGPLSKETQLKLLQLEEARVLLQTAEEKQIQAKRNLADMKELYEQDVVTGKEVSDADAALKDAGRSLDLAKIDLQKTALSFLQDATHISILEAYQYIDADNNRTMSVTFINDSDFNLAALGLQEGVAQLGITKDAISGLLTIENLYVSVKVGATIVGDPFEVKVPQLKLNERKNLTFKLKNQADEVSLTLKYQSREDVHNIYLEKKSQEDIVRMSSLQFAQEGRLGTSVDFGLELERLAEDEKTFTLGCIGLPEKYRTAFTDSGKQISQVKFSPGGTRRSLALKVSVPDKLGGDELKVPIRFFAVVGDDDAVRELERRAMEGKTFTAEDLTLLKIGHERLELTPQGSPRLDVEFSTLYYEAMTDEPLETRMTVSNGGSVRLDDIRFAADAPLDWTVEFDPDEAASLEPRKEIEVTVRVKPIQNVEVGAYELKISAATDYEGAEVKSDQKTVRIQLSARTNLTLNLAIVGGLILFILIIAVVTVRISRR